MGKHGYKSIRRTSTNRPAQRVNEPPSIAVLSVELIGNILRLAIWPESSHDPTSMHSPAYMDRDTAFQLTRVCKTWRSLIYSNSIWFWKGTADFTWPYLVNGANGYKVARYQQYIVEKPQTALRIYIRIAPLQWTAAAERHRRDFCTTLTPFFGVLHLNVQGGTPMLSMPRDWSVPSFSLAGLKDIKSFTGHTIRIMLTWIDYGVKPYIEQVLEIFTTFPSLEYLSLASIDAIWERGNRESCFFATLKELKLCDIDPIDAIECLRMMVCPKLDVLHLLQMRKVFRLRLSPDDLPGPSSLTNIKKLCWSSDNIWNGPLHGMIIKMLVERMPLLETLELDTVDLLYARQLRQQSHVTRPVV